MPAAPGTEMELEMPGTTVQAMPASASAWASSMPRPKTNGSPPLRRTTALPCLGVLDQGVVDGLLGHEAAVGDLRGVDDLDVRREFVEQVAGAEPVGDDDVGLGEQTAAADGDQVRVAGAAADEGDAGGAGAVVRGDQGAVAQALDDARRGRRRSGAGRGR